MTHRLLMATTKPLYQYPHTAAVFLASAYAVGDKQPKRTWKQLMSTTALLWRPGWYVPCLFLLN